MAEQFKLTKKRTIALVVLLVVLFLYNLYEIFTVDNWTSFRPYRFILLGLAYVYGIYFFIKKYKESK